MKEGNAVEKSKLLAESSAEVIEIGKSSDAAEKEAIKARVRYDQIQIFIEMVRSKESTARAMINLR